MVAETANLNTVEDFGARLGDDPTEMERWLHQTLKANHRLLAMGWPHNRPAMTEIRDAAIGYFGYAIITREVVDGIIEVARKHRLTTLFGVGSGTGYLEQELQARTSALSITSTDPDRSHLSVDVHCNHREVLRGVREVNETGLLLSWPQHKPDTDWPTELVEKFTGRLIFYIGEGEMGCTGTAGMHRALERLYRPLRHDITLPTFSTIHDRLVIYERK